MSAQFNKLTTQYNFFLIYNSKSFLCKNCAAPGKIPLQKYNQEVVTYTFLTPSTYHSLGSAIMVQGFKALKKGSHARVPPSKNQKLFITQPSRKLILKELCKTTPDINSSFIISFTIMRPGAHPCISVFGENPKFPSCRCSKLNCK